MNDRPIEARSVLERSVTLVIEHPIGTFNFLFRKRFTDRVTECYHPGLCIKNFCGKRRPDPYYLSFYLFIFSLLFFVSNCTNYIL